VLCCIMRSFPCPTGMSIKRKKRREGWGEFKRKSELVQQGRTSWTTGKRRSRRKDIFTTEELAFGLFVREKVIAGKMPLKGGGEGSRRELLRKGDWSAKMRRSSSRYSFEFAPKTDAGGGRTACGENFWEEACRGLLWFCLCGDWHRSEVGGAIYFI